MKTSCILPVAAADGVSSLRLAFSVDGEDMIDGMVGKFNAVKREKLVGVGLYLEYGQDKMASGPQANGRTVANLAKNQAVSSSSSSIVSASHLTGPWASISMCSKVARGLSMHCC